MFISADNPANLKIELEKAISEAKHGNLPAPQLPEPHAQALPERLAIDYGDVEEFIKRAEKTLTVFGSDNPAMWQALTAQGVYRGSGTPGKVAFLFPGQGSQYVNMLRELREIEPVVDDVFIEADRVMTPLLGKPLTAYIYADGDKESLKAAEDELKNTAITQPAVLTANIALLRLLQKYGFEPDMVIGHSLGEYAALVAAGVLTFAEALEVVSARGREMSKVSMDDNGCMAAVSAPLAEVERILTTIDGYVVLANINSPLQSVIAGATTAVEAAIEAFKAADFQAVKIPVSHAFHTKIVAPASLPLRNVIDHMNLQSPKLPIAANVTGDWYPSEREAILDMLADQVASPVQFIKGAQKLYDGGARIFVEVGPKRVMNALSNDIFKENNDVTIVATNHPRKGALPSFNEALCALYSAGLPLPDGKSLQTAVSQPTVIVENHSTISDGRQPLTGSVVISGAGLGLPGKNGLVFAEDNIQRLLNGEIRIEPFSEATRHEMLNRRVTRLEKSEAGAVMVNIDDLEDTVKLAGQRGAFNLAEEFGVPEDRAEATDIATQLAIAAGIDALRDAGIPLVMDYRTTSRDTLLPNRWMLPDALKDETGVIFASAFPGLDRMAQETESYYRFEALKNQHAELNQILNLTNGNDSAIRQALLQRLEELQKQIDDTDYHFDRRFIFRILAMGHSQFAEHIGARGPNTAVNAACATTTHAVSIAEDWIRTGRCRRVIIVAGDDVTSGSLSNWISTGLLASGAATTEGNVRMAALPFDRRRNGMIMGMGAAALVVESQDAVEERGMRAICELLSCQIANSAFHGTRLDINHVSQVMERVVHQAEERFGIKRSDIAAQTVFVSHETYTPARGGSAAAEIHALRRTFGDQANKVVIANTKGFTGHTMGVGVEDVIAAKALEFGIVPPIANYDGQFEPDPELGDLNLSHGGAYPIKYSLRLGAGFGSQIAMTLLRKIEGSGERVNKPLYQQWLAAVSGYPQPEMEVVQHNLRIKHTGPPIMKPVASNWKYGQGPTAWADQQPSLSSNPISTPIAVAITEQSVTIETPKVSVETVSDDEITRQVLTRVSEKTGYPMEMLDLELDLEADLGIDTVKQAELFASIREFYEIPRREDLRLSEYNTLEKVIGFVRDSIGTTTEQQIPMPLAVEQKTTPEPSTNSEALQSFVLSAVAEKTGYPIEMLDLDLDLEADLGIDTVKQAELFASIREHFGIPRREDLRLSEYNTLAKVIQFVIDAQSDLQKAEEEVIEPINEKSEEVETSNTASVRRRVPIAVLRPRLDICKPTSVTFNQDSRVIVFKDKGRVSVALQKHLKTIGVNPLVLISAQPSEIFGQIEQWLSEGPILGLYYLPTLDSEELLSKMDLAGWQETLESRFHNLVSALRSLPELSFLVVATRFDGLHGLSNAGAHSPISGAAAGFAKAIARERKGMTVKVVDFESNVRPAQLASRLVDENSLRSRSSGSRLGR